MTSAKSSFKKNEAGIWEKDGVAYPRVARIATVKSLAVLGIPQSSGLLRLNAFVTYHPEKIFQQQFGDKRSVFFVSVSAAEEAKGKKFKVPLFVLDLSISQKKELVEFKNKRRGKVKPISSNMMESIAAFEEQGGLFQ